MLHQLEKGEIKRAISFMKTPCKHSKRRISFYYKLKLEGRSIGKYQVP